MAAGRGRPGLRVVIVATSLIVGLLFVGAAWFLPEGSRAAVILFGAAQAGAERGATLLPYPFSMQNFMWIVTFWGFGEIWLRIHRSRQDREPLADRLSAGRRRDDAAGQRSGSDLSAGSAGRLCGYGLSAAPDPAHDPAVPKQPVDRPGQFSAEFNPRALPARNRSALQPAALSDMADSDHGLSGHRHRDRGCPSVAGKADFADQEAMNAMMPTMTGSLGVAFYTTLLAPPPVGAAAGLSPVRSGARGNECSTVPANTASIT